LLVQIGLTFGKLIERSETIFEGLHAGRPAVLTFDALCHAWDPAASLGRPLEFPPVSVPAVTAVVEATCTDAVRALGLIKDVVSTAPGASDIERLMAQAGRVPPCR
jgi:hypothetical protein